MFEKKIRRAGKAIIERIALVFVALRVSPNFVTILSFVAGIIGVYFVSIKELNIAVVLIFLSGIFDAVDGAIARLTNKSSNFGAFLDSTLDKVLEAGIFFGIFFYDKALALPLMLAISCMLLSSYTNKHIAAFNIKKTDNRPFFYIYTFADRIERMAIVMIALIFPVFLREILYFYIFVVGLSFVQRLIEGLKILK